jgi:excisionase family DNA binding protein
MTSRPHDDVEPLLSTTEVASMFHVQPVTVTRWANAGKLTLIRTPGGHRRYLAAEVEKLRGADRTDEARQ